MKVRVSGPARRDLDEIWLFIARDSLEIADQFVDALTEKFTKLAASPRIGRVRDDLSPGLFCFPIKSYLIFYQFTESRLDIVRVLHAARDTKVVFEDS